MILADCHVHSCFSSDADTPVEQMIEAAIAQGRKYFYLTDHHDFDYPIGEDGRDFQLPREDYTLRLEQLRDAYKDKIELRIGVEMGLIDPERYLPLLQKRAEALEAAGCRNAAAMLMVKGGAL